MINRPCPWNGAVANVSTRPMYLFERKALLEHEDPLICIQIIDVHVSHVVTYLAIERLQQCLITTSVRGRFASNRLWIDRSVI